MNDLKVGILGLGRGITHLRNFIRAEGAHVIGACDLHPQRRERAASVAAEAGVDLALVTRYDELLDLKPDAIVVSSAATLHVTHAIAALDAGCHVLNEVPGGYTEAELLNLRATVERTGKTYMLGENTCYWDFFRYWAKWVREGLFGAVSMAEGEYLHYLPNSLTTQDGERITPSEALAKGVSASPSWRAAMPPIQYLTHDLGPLLEVLDDRVVSVTCRSAPSRGKEGPLRPDGQIALFQTAKGSLIRITVTFNTRRPEEHRYRLFGTEGSVEHARYEGFTRRFTKDAEHGSGWEIVPIDLAARDDDTSTGHGGADLKVAQAFTNAILEGRPAPIDVYRAIDYALPGIYAARSADLGGVPVSVPDIRPTPFTGSSFWDTVGLPEKDPETRSYKDAVETLRG